MVIFKAVRIELSQGAFVQNLPRFLPGAEADAAFDALLQELAWEQRQIVLFGKAIWQPRLVAWGGALPYRYSGQTLPPRALTTTTAALLERVRRETDVPFNHVLANRYRDGNDSMGLHADAETELGSQPVIATLSLGASRRFRLVPRRKSASGQAGAPPEQAKTFELGHGGLLVMGGTCQRHYRHGIPREAGSVGERISLTFRHVVGAPAETPGR